MPLALGRTSSGDLLWVENPFTGVVTYLTDIHLKRSGFEASAATTATIAPGPAPAPAPDLAELSRTCAFCPGNEHMTTREIARRRSDATNAWSTRSFLNLFPRIPTECTGGKNESYLLVETPDHFRDEATDSEHLVYTAALGAPHFRDILSDAMSLATLSFTNPAVTGAVIRKNQGRQSGASQPHPHTQVIGSGRPFGPIAREKEVLERDPDLWRQILDFVDRERLLIAERAGCFLYFSPFGTFPRSYEVVDTRSSCRSDEIDPPRLEIFADLLHRALEILGDTPLDYEIHAEPGLPLHAHINARHYPYSNIAGTLNLPIELFRLR